MEKNKELLEEAFTAVFPWNAELSTAMYRALADTSSEANYAEEMSAGRFARILELEAEVKQLTEDNAQLERENRRLSGMRWKALLVGTLLNSVKADVMKELDPYGLTEENK